MGTRILIFISFHFSFYVLFSQQYVGKPVDVKFSYSLNNFEYCSFYEFQIKESTELDDPSLRLLKDQKQASGFFNPSSIDSYLNIHSMITFNYRGEEIAVIGYSENSGETKLYNSFPALVSIERYENIFKLTNDAFWQFYN